ncbi:hypothetical protein [Massilia polaris]|nr:hypothetical protein [Massilia polaris]
MMVSVTVWLVGSCIARQQHGAGIVAEQVVARDVVDIFPPP